MTRLTVTRLPRLAVIGLAATTLVGCGGNAVTSGISGSAGAETPPTSGTSSPAGSGSVSASSGSADSPSAPSGTDTSPANGTATRAAGGTAGATGTGAPIPWDTGGRPLPADLPSAASGPARLTILLDDGLGVRTTWTLTCDPVGGIHPEPADACGVLGARGAIAFQPPPADAICTQQYGGPQKARITGTWRGDPVTTELSLENGCQITRWTALLGLLPPGSP